MCPLEIEEDNDLLSDTHLRNVKQEIKAWLMRWRRKGKARLHWASLHTYQPGRVKGWPGFPWAKRTQGKNWSGAFFERNIPRKGFCVTLNVISQAQNNHSKSSKTLPAPTFSLPSCFIPRGAKDNLVGWMRWKKSAERGKEKKRQALAFAPPVLKPSLGKGKKLCILMIVQDLGV